MAIFGRKKKRDKKQVSVEQAPTKQYDDEEDEEDAPHHDSTRRKKSPSPVEATMDMLPELVEHLATSADTSGETPARALRMLFSLSEKAETDNREIMVREAGGMLVPELLDFLKRCGRSSSEQYLALLVLNNVSIPSENKRLIALDCGGAQTLARLLCLDPSCHLMAIILVNLTFSDVDLRKELVTRANTELIESLSFALRVASFTQEEYDVRQPLSVPNEYEQYTPSYLLRAIVEDDVRTRPALGDYNTNKSASNYHHHDVLVDPAHMMYPETARWCLSALKNLSRPGKDSPAANTLVNCGIMNHIMRFICIAGPSDVNMQQETENFDLPAVEKSHEAMDQ
jgi:hypothetical protein